MTERKGKMALDIIRTVSKYFLDILDIKDYGDKLIIEIKRGRDGFTR
ncbi:hypothetical protein [Methanothermococcus okinawensis]|uniref:Uncharacterized protein n=1 Tax=Methanothermococcus okinawensis (strain DSM 14208 / JCM 11175 / IH1) TaxID=647113 RepID=F8ANU3_METOI|nr:hypothetical protein [Methanothermococcus okinawensis]AEH06296.1 hypothetical protein Metok_0306 [Methanothermococcus okinawensis IH1]